MNREKMNRDMNRESTRKAIGAVDIGGTKIAVGVVDETGRVLARAECGSEVPRGFDEAMNRVTALLGDCAERAGVKLRGIGIGSAGPVDTNLFPLDRSIRSILAPRTYGSERVKRVQA